ncbi:MAG: hypothetical protein ACK5Y2_02785 [Bdellovibrionales bacterium]
MNHLLIFFRRFQNEFPWGILALAALWLMLWTSAHGQATKVKDFVPPPPNIEHFSFGLRHQLADTLWVRAIQDFDYCEEKLAEHLCKGNGWLSKILLAIVRLDPDFYMVYFTGGLSLTVLVSDYEGASQVFDLGVAKFPDQWRLLFAAAYHALYEEKNEKKAADLYLAAAKNGAPEWVFALANRLYQKTGDTQMTDEILSLMKNVIKDEEMLAKIQDRIQNKQKALK